MGKNKATQLFDRLVKDKAKNSALSEAMILSSKANSCALTIILFDICFYCWKNVLKNSTFLQ